MQLEIVLLFTNIHSVWERIIAPYPTDGRLGHMTYDSPGQGKVSGSKCATSD